MFTGIVEDVGRVRGISGTGTDRSFVIEVDKLTLGGLSLGDSIAVQGVCLTITAKNGKTFSADVSGETLSVTTLGGCQSGSRVNLEPALTLGKLLGGHLVSGHVDGVGTLVSRDPDGRSERFRIAMPASLARYVATKGSVTVDGVSLTVNAVGDSHFDVNLIPHTLRHTTLGDYQPGQLLNLEVDLLARYLERLLAGGAETVDSEGGE